MQKKYIQPDKVQSITLTYERESAYKWYPEVPAKPKTFLGIQYGMTKAIPAGWSDYGELYRKTSGYFNQDEWYRVDEINKKIYNTAHVSIRLGYKECISLNFNSNEEAQKYVDDLINSSDKQFHVSVNF